MRCDLLLRTCLRRLRSGIRLVTARRHCTVVRHFPTKNVTVDRRQCLIEERIERLRGQIADIGFLPGNDVENFRQLAIAGHDGRVEFEAIAAAGRRRLLAAGCWLLARSICTRRRAFRERLRLFGSSGICTRRGWFGRERRGRRQGKNQEYLRSFHHSALALRCWLPSRVFSSVTHAATLASGEAESARYLSYASSARCGCWRYRSHSTPRLRCASA